MAGIVFFATESLPAVLEWYRDVLDFETWLEQPDCTILRRGNLLLGFCERDRADTDGIVTVLVDSRAAVEEFHERLGDRAEGPPSENERYRIFHCFGTDPDGRAVEIQTFLHEIEPIPGVDE